MDHAAHAKRLRDRAEECRVLAEIIKGQEARDSYLKLAEAYEALASDETAMSSNKAASVSDVFHSGTRGVPLIGPSATRLQENVVTA
jgi:hypothetical protein